jgi:hypothetical protein
MEEERRRRRERGRNSVHKKELYNREDGLLYPTQLFSA